MKKAIFSISLAIAVGTSFLACNQESATEPDEGRILEGKEPSEKKPLEFDVSTILTPPNNSLGSQKNALKKASSTYYQFFPGTHITWDDFNTVCITGCGLVTSVVEATYASRFTSIPEDLWTPNHGNRLQTGDLDDGEQGEVHFFVPTGSGTPGGTNPRTVAMNWNVSSEAGYDKLYITSTASDGSCNSPGVVRLVASGVQSGSISFSIPGNCGTIWIGAYYIKDGSLSSGDDRATIQSLEVTY